jgi:hypothetical protein
LRRRPGAADDRVDRVRAGWLAGVRSVVAAVAPVRDLAYLLGTATVVPRAPLELRLLREADVNCAYGGLLREPSSSLTPFVKQGLRVRFSPRAPRISHCRVATCIIWDAISRHACAFVGALPGHRVVV